MNCYWIARYNDGTQLTQYESDGHEHNYGDIDRSKLESFIICQKAQALGHVFSIDLAIREKVIFHLHLEPEQRLIYRRRTHKTPSGDDMVTYLVGWQQTVKGKNVQALFLIHDDGTIEAQGRWRDDAFWEAPERAPEDDKNFVLPSEE